MESHHLIIGFVLITLCWLTSNTTSQLHAQISVILNSVADDADAHAWDDPLTEADESKDGKVQDMADRKTLRAAIEEAWNMNDGAGVPIDITIDLGGEIALTSGSLQPPDGSNLHGGFTTAISGGIGIGNNTTVRGLIFVGSGGAVIGISVGGDRNTISGNAFDQLGTGILVGGVSNVIGGSTKDDRNVIVNCTDGIMLVGDDNVVIGNHIGVDARSNIFGNLRGIIDFGKNNMIGGTDPGTRNVISGNSLSGITVSAVDPAFSGICTIIGNYIGTDSAGTQSRPNQFGIQVSAGRAVIGGILPAEKNIISGNTVGGIETRGDALTVQIIGNDIGLDVGGLPLGNRDGIEFSPGSFDGVIQGNRISNNSDWGVYILGTAADPSWNHRIRGNEITRNGFAGIGILGKANDIVVGSSLTQDFDPNQIQYNAQIGVLVQTWSGEIPRANTIRKNDFRNNGDIGINIVSPTINVQDGIYPPGIQGYSDIGGGTAMVTVTHDRPGSLIDVYGAEVNDSSHYEGRQWLGSGTVTNSNVPFGFAISSCGCSHIVATATDPAENTSEFSNAFDVSGTTDVRKDGKRVPTSFLLGDAYPNPFNPTTNLSFVIGHFSFVSLKVYDVVGKEVATIVNEQLPAGEYTKTWDAVGVPSGVYFYRLRAGKFNTVKKLVISR